MVTPIKITGIGYEVDDNTRKYVEKRISRLERYIPKHARRSLTGEVKLAEVNNDHGNKYQVEVILNLPGKVITAKDSTGNALAAVDIVEAKIQTQLRDYKQAAIAHVGNRGVMSRFKRSFKREL